jgi:superfamily II DNA or RNA helicase
VYTDLHFDPIYTTQKNDVVSEFYVPALSVAVQYDRVTGFFSSSALSVAARGLSKFVLKRGSKIRLLVSCKGFQESDKISTIYSVEDSIINEFNKVIDEDIAKLEDLIVKDRIAALAWLLKTGRLEIKVARMTPNQYEQGILHSKFGVLTDEQDQKICFSGSINESKTGWRVNGEVISIFKSFESGQKEYVDRYIQEFNDYWENRVEGVTVVDLPQAIKQKFITYSPDQIEGTASQIDPETKLKGARKLRYYQVDAVNSWIDNKMRGYFEMATGTGKTVAAIHCLREALQKVPGLGVIIAVPTRTLVDQWAEELEKEGFERDSVTCCDSDFKGWHETFWRYALIPSVSNKIFVFTYASLMDSKTQDYVSKSKREFVLVCDEMHHAGAPEFSNCLNSKVELRLGLSATPIRSHDVEGSALLLDYFGEKPLIKFDIDRALTEVDPVTNKTYLCQYNYHFDTVELSDTEHSEFMRLSKDIAMKMLAKKRGKKDDEEYQPDKLRALVISCAIEKLDKLSDLVKELKKAKNYKKMLVYCQSFKPKDAGDKQLHGVKKVLDENSLHSLEYTSRFSDRDYRQDILNDLREDIIDAVIAIKCLDEGVDLPAVKTAIILASSSNSAEFIQRRGRVLRNSPGKLSAEIYDFLVGPPHGIELKESDITLIKRELARVLEYARCAKNGESLQSKITSWLQSYGLKRGDIVA